MTFFLPDNDPLKHKMCSPEHVCRTMCRTATKGNCPSSARIIQDCDSVLNEIVASKATHIDDKCLRNGVRREGRQNNVEQRG